jgi:hypothetical protein
VLDHRRADDLFVAVGGHDQRGAVQQQRDPGQDRGGRLDRVQHRDVGDGERGHRRDELGGGGRALASKTFSIDTGSSSIIFNAANLAGGGTVTITNAFGCLVYDNTITAGTVAKQGLCFNYFGGAQSVTGGTFTILWATPSGAAETAVFNITV